MTIPTSSGEWNLDRLQRLVSQHDLEGGRIEYKRELGNGNQTLEAIAALSNTFGGVVLIGVDETKQGVDRLIGVEATDRDRLARMCWDKLVPPFNPEIVPVQLANGNRVVLVVIISPDYIRRPVMLTQGNKIPVRIEGHNVPADWYRLRDLFTERPAGVTRLVLPADHGPYTANPRDFPLPALCIRGRLLLAGPRGRPLYITEASREAVMAALNNEDSLLTGSHSALSHIMRIWTDGTWKPGEWNLEGRASTHMVNVRWSATGPRDQRIGQARLRMVLTQSPEQGDSLLVSADITLKYPKPARLAFDDTSDHLDIGEVRQLLLAILATLWGPLGDTASISILGLPLGPPAELALTVSTVQESLSSDSYLSHYITFGPGQRIPGNTPGSWTPLPAVQPDHSLFSPVEQERLVNDWITYLIIDNGYRLSE